MGTPATDVAPVNLLITRRVAPGCYDEFLAWLEQGRRLAREFPGHLGSGVLEPPPGGTEYQIVFRFLNDASLQAWASSPQRQAWLAAGSALVHDAHALRASGLDGWFGVNPPPRWKQAIAIWLAFFPVSLAFTAGLGDYLEALPLFWRVLLSTLMLTPVMVFVFIPLATRMLRNWLRPRGEPVDPGHAV